MIMEAEVSLDLPSASWRPRKASGAIQFRVQRPEDWGRAGGSGENLSLSPRA